MEKNRRIKRGHRTNRKIEASKKIVIFCDTLTALTVIAAFAGWLTGHDVVGLDGIVTAVVALSGAAHSFYFWKAKAENLQKFGMADHIIFEEERG